MNTISDILMDIDRGCLANNMIEDCFTYRIVYFVNEGNNGKKYYLDSSFTEIIGKYYQREFNLDK